MIHLLTGKLDFSACKEWQIAATTNRIATFTELTDFLNKRCQTLEALASAHLIKSNNQPSPKQFLSKGAQLKSNKNTNQSQSTTVSYTYENQKNSQAVLSTADSMTI